MPFLPPPLVRRFRIRTDDSSSRFGVLTAGAVALVLLLTLVVNHEMISHSAGSAPSITEVAQMVNVLLVEPRVQGAAPGADLHRRFPEGLHRESLGGAERIVVVDRNGDLVVSTTAGKPTRAFQPGDRGLLQAAIQRGAPVQRILPDGTVEAAVPVRDGNRIRGAMLLAVPRRDLGAGSGYNSFAELLPLTGGGLLCIVLLLNGTVARRRRMSESLGAYAAQKEYLARHDHLTGLANRLELRDSAHTVIVSRQGEEKVALLLLDLDEFKEINDTLGHSSGDRLLRDVADRLGRLTAGQELVARVGGDEFALLIPAVPSTEHASEIAERVYAALERPFSVDGSLLDIHPSIGVALIPDHAAVFDDLMKCADIAMYQAKRHRSRIETFHADHELANRRSAGLASELRRAISGGELRLDYQPKARMCDNSVTGVEGLVRWVHPIRGIIPPGDFISLAERSGLMRSLSLAVLEQAVAQVREWLDLGIELSVAINLSTRDLVDVKLVDEVAGCLKRNNIPPHLLELEITESVLMADPRRAGTILARLKEIGVSTAIDDFGTGYSSLGYLRDLPLTSLKIDRSFVRSMQADRPDEVIVRSTIDLAHNLGLAVVGEGIEEARTWNRLKELGCDYGQGFLLSRPLSPEALLEWLRSPRLHQLRAA
jgi:diguanylate cyclase (GGDEF)-like protein